MIITSFDTRRIIPPLRLIFWGGLICVLDFTLNQFDLINDVIGVIMVTWGIFKLSKLQVHARYSTAMLFIKIVAVLACFNTYYDQFSHQSPKYLSIFLSLFDIVVLIAIVSFCIAMCWLSTEAHLRASTKSWKTTTLLFSVLYLIPTIITHIAVALTATTLVDFVRDSSVDFGLPAALLFLPMLIALMIPMIYFFLSTSKMKNEAQMSLSQ